MKKSTLSVVSCNHNGLLVSGSGIAELKGLCENFTAELVDGVITVRGSINKRKAIRKILADAARDYATFTHPLRVVNCIVEKNGRTFVGHAICAPGDWYDYETGKAIAYLRAVGKPVPSFLTA